MPTFAYLSQANPFFVGNFLYELPHSIYRNIFLKGKRAEQSNNNNNSSSKFT